MVELQSKAQISKVFSRPTYESKFINNSILNFEEFNLLLKNINPSNIEVITSDGKFFFQSSNIYTNPTFIVSNTKDIKPIFKDLINVFKEKYPILKNCKRNDVHVYAGYSNQSATFGIHTDNSYTIILQCEGKSKWVLPKDFEVELSCGDIIWIPKGTKHGCFPVTKRISLSFAFWDN